MIHCPSCRTELVSRNNVPVCPRNEIGECHFDGYSQWEEHMVLNPDDASKHQPAASEVL